MSQLKEKALKRAGLSEEQVKQQIEQRALARKNKQFELSDAIRKELYTKGIALMDEPQGTVWRPCELPEIQPEHPEIQSTKQNPEIKQNEIH